MPSLTAKQQRFVDEYLVDLNATQAAIRAGYSAKSANVTGTQNLAKPSIAAVIAEKSKAVAEKNDLEGDRWVKEISRIAFSDVRGLFDDETGCMLDPKDWSDDIAAAVQSIEVDEVFDNADGERRAVGLRKKVRFWDKNAALDKAAKFMRLYQEMEVNHRHSLDMSSVPDDVLRGIVDKVFGQGARVIEGERMD